MHSLSSKLSCSILITAASWSFGAFGADNTIDQAGVPVDSENVIYEFNWYKHHPQEPRIKNRSHTHLKAGEKIRPMKKNESILGSPEPYSRPKK